MVSQPVVNRLKVGLGSYVQQMLETRDDEIATLKLVEQIIALHDPRQIEFDPPNAGRGQRVNRLAVARQQSRAIGPQRAMFPDQPELDGVQVQPAQLIDRVEAFRAEARVAVCDEEIGEHRIGQHRQVPEQVMEQVGLFGIVERGRRAQKVCRRKAPL